MSDNKPKLPDVPNFLKKDEDKKELENVIPPKFKVPDMSQADEVKPKVQEEPSANKKNLFSKNKGKVPLIEFRNDKGDMVPSAAPPKAPPAATLNDYFPPVVGQVLALLLLISVGAGLFFYYQAEGYKNKYQAIETRVLSFTKEIASLNQENNSLSGKIVNYKKELEGVSGNRVSELEKQVIDLQNQIATYKTLKPATTSSETIAPISTTVVKPIESADPVPSQQGKVPNTPTIVTNKMTPLVNQPNGSNLNNKATDSSVNYEVKLKTKGETSCLQYYKTENLKKCQSKNSKYTEVVIGSKNYPSGTRLVYQCQGQGVKSLNFKYGPMEIYNNCVGR